MLLDIPAHTCCISIGVIMVEIRRPPAVAGMLYQKERNRLLQELEASFLGSLGPGRLPEGRHDGPRKVIGLVSPHAGYAYSGISSQFKMNFTCSSDSGHWGASRL